jgi:hypothetical protein
MVAEGGLGRRLVFGLVVALAAFVARAQTHEFSAEPSSCALSQAPGGLEDMRTESCVACHGRGKELPRDGHPVDIDYAGVQGRGGAGLPLRPLAEVIRRGVLLPEGQVRCATCHDPRSTWRYFLALPSGSVPMPAVDPKNPETYEEGPAREALVRAVQAATPGQRLQVTAKPLCLACHEVD